MSNPGINLSGQEQWERRGANESRLRSIERSRIVATSTTRPLNPKVGQIVFDTDLGDEVWWTGTEWRRVVGIYGASYLTQAFSAGSTASTTYVDAPGPMDLAFTKRASGTNLEIDLRMSCYMGTATNRVVTAVSIAGVDYAITQFYFNALGAHAAFSAVIALGGIAAGAYTARLRWAVAAGPGSTVYTDTGDQCFMKITEVK